MTYRVMLADDEPIMRKALLTLADWESMECEIVYTAANGQEVMENLEKVMPDILITDIKMPGKNGIELAKYIWEQKLPIKVIILTGYADFAYAQSAVKFNVVDYVIKAGAFDGLLEAVEKAKERIQKRKEEHREEDNHIQMQNLLKSVFDGSLYDENEIEEACINADFLVGKVQYYVILLRFRVQGEERKHGGKTIYESLTNFFSMVFTKQMCGAVAVERDTFALVLSEINGKKELQYQCMQIIDMMDNFMKMHSYIGISSGHLSTKELKVAYNEAEEALECSFMDEESKINFYQPRNHQEEVMSADIEKRVKHLCGEIKKGNVTCVKADFSELIDRFKEERCSSHLIKNAGINIQNQCRNILSEYDKTIYEVTGIENSISKTIYRCRFLKEYERILYDIVVKTAESVHIAVNKKETLIYECEKFIEENFHKNILVADVAKYVGASPSYLSRVFKEMVGKTLISTINEKKIEKAKEYLLHTDMKIYEIAEALGFEDTTYFSHFFKKYTKMSPKEYKGGTK